MKRSTKKVLGAKIQSKSKGSITILDFSIV